MIEGRTFRSQDDCVIVHWSRSRFFLLSRFQHKSNLIGLLKLGIGLLELGNSDAGLDNYVAQLSLAANLENKNTLHNACCIAQSVLGVVSCQ